MKETAEIIVKLSTGSSFVDTGPWGFNNGRGAPYLGFADFNGDGRSDLWYVNNNTTQVVVGLSTGKPLCKDFESGFYGHNIWATNDGWAGSPYLGFADFNGDGKSDLWYVKKGTTQIVVKLSSGSSFGTGTIWATNNGWAGSPYLGFADFNGDGKSDLWYVANGGTKIVVKLSTGSAFGEGIISATNNDVAWARCPWGFQDFNGDGKSDLWYVKESTAKIIVKLFTGSAFGGGTIWATNNGWAGYPYLGFADFNGDGKSDLWYVKKSTAMVVVKKAIQTCSNKMASITTAFGENISIYYSQASQFYDRILDGITDKPIDPTNTTFPNIANSAPRDLVTGITVLNGRGAAYQTIYSYNNGRIYRGMPYETKNLNFETMTQQTYGTDLDSTIFFDVPGPITKTYYYQEWYRAYAGLVKKVVQFTSDNKLMERQEFFYSAVPEYYCGGLPNWVRTYQIIKKSFEMGNPNYENDNLVYTNIKTFNSYDSYGNVTQTTSSASGLEDIVTTIAYNYDIAAWIVARPAEIKQTSGKATLKWQMFNYDSNNRLASTEERSIEGGRWITKSYTYDEYGNVLTITDPLFNTTIFQYDTLYHTFPVTITNALGHATQVIYDYSTGNKLAVKDPNNNMTQYVYDQYKRLIQVIEPGDSIYNPTKKVLYHDELLGNANTQYIETQLKDDSDDGYMWQKRYFDGLKRTYKTVSEGSTYEDTIYDQVSERVFDELGRLKKKSEPYYTNCGSVNYTQYKYDTAGRVIKETYPDSTSVSIYYSYGTNFKSITKTDANGVSHICRYNARNQLIYRADSGATDSSTVSYSYDPAGNLTAVTDAGGKVTTISYDSLGRKTSINDPNASLSIYTYYDNGSIKTSTDAMGQTITYQYDALDRLTLEDYPGAMTDINYEYDNTLYNDAKGRLTQVTDESGTTNYAYDARGNNTHLRKVINDGDINKTYDFEFSYDFLNRLKTMTYPDGSVLEKHYADGGHLQSVTLDGNTIVSYNRVASEPDTCSEFIVKRHTGNGVNTLISYDPKTARPVNVKTYTPNGDEIENVTYQTYDNMGNIETLVDNFNSITENYTYDSLSRLKNATASGLYGSLDYEYLPNGNMTIKDGIPLTYDSSSAHPHAVIGYNGNVFTYDANGNMETRNGKRLVYDAKNQLKEIKDGVTDDAKIIESYLYNYAGTRFKKKTAGGTIVYDFGGFFEVKKIPDPANPGQYTFENTKYIYGIKGDRAAKITCPGDGFNADIFPFSQNMYNWKDWKGFFLKVYASLNSLASNSANYRIFVMSIMVMALMFALGLLLYNQFFRREELEQWHRWMGNVIPVLFVLIFAVFGMTGCFEFLVNDAVIDGISYFHPNHVGSVKLVTDKDGNRVAEYKYKPYGELVESHSTGTGISKYKYTGQEADDTGLYYYNARYYDPSIGRFVSADTIVPDPTDPQAYNRYLYGNGNPLKYCDPTGHMGEVIPPYPGTDPGTGYIPPTCNPPTYNPPTYSPPTNNPFTITTGTGTGTYTIGNTTYTYTYGTADVTANPTPCALPTTVDFPIFTYEPLNFGIIPTTSENSYLTFAMDFKAGSSSGSNSTGSIYMDIGAAFQSQGQMAVEATTKLYMAAGLVEMGALSVMLAPAIIAFTYVNALAISTGLSTLQKISPILNYYGVSIPKMVDGFCSFVADMANEMLDAFIECGSAILNYGTSE